MTVREHLVQCIGRLRDTQHLEEIIHVTNHRNIPKIEEYDGLHKQYNGLFRSIIKGYNACINVGMPQLDIMRKFIENFGVQMRGGKYRFDYNRYDQVIHGLYSKQVYNQDRKSTRLNSSH